MLARTYGPRFDSFPCYIQPKFDGVRALYQSGVLQSRDEKIWLRTKHPALFDELASAHSLIGKRLLDGELYVHGWKLQRINGAMATNSPGPRDDTHLVEYHIFDCIDERGFSAPFSKRWFEFAQQLRALDLPHVKIATTGYVEYPYVVDHIFNELTAYGYEGIMLRPDGPYETGQTDHGTERRSRYLWKHKQWEDGEFRCIGTTAGEGKADIGIGALVLQTDPQGPASVIPDPAPFKVGTGFSDEERILYASNPPIGRLVKVKYRFLTNDGIPFNPSFICILE